MAQRRGHALVGREGHVEARRALYAAGVPGELDGAVRGEAVVETLKVAAVDLAAVLEAEQAIGIEPHPVRLLACRVVLVGVAERALTLQVVRGGGGLGEGGYHGAVSLAERCRATVLACRATVASAAGTTLIGFRSLHHGKLASIRRRLYHPSFISAIGTSVHRCAEASSTFIGFAEGDSVHATGPIAGTGKARVGWGPIAGIERGVR